MVIHYPEIRHISSNFAVTLVYPKMGGGATENVCLNGEHDDQPRDIEKNPLKDT